MSLESPNQQAENLDRKSWKRGLALKSLIAITNGVLGRDVRAEKEKGFLISAIEKAKSTYTSLDSLEREIDPTGNLSGEIEERITSNLDSLKNWLKQRI